MKQIEAAIGTKVELEIPYDARLYLKSINEGIPIVRGATTSAPAAALGKLAAAAAGIDERSASIQDGRRARLGGLRRRG